jgi:hypothetical protein
MNMSKHKNKDTRDAHGNNPGQDNFNARPNRENTGQNGHESTDQKSEREK